MYNLKHKIKSNSGFTLVEVLVSTVVFVLATAGLFATISALSQPAGESTHEVSAAFAAKAVLEELRSKVDQSTWDSGDLTIGNHGPTQVTINNITYDINYVVEADPAGTAARKVTLTITWPDP